MSEVNITDSVLKRHHEQQLSVSRLSSVAGSTTHSSAAASTETPGIQSNAPSSGHVSDSVQHAAGTGGLMKKVIPIILVILVIWLIMKVF